MNEWIIIRRIIALAFLARVFYHVIARRQPNIQFAIRAVNKTKQNEKNTGRE